MIERFSPKNCCFNCQDRQKMYAQRLRRNSEKYMSIYSKKGENYGIIIIHIHFVLFMHNALRAVCSMRDTVENKETKSIHKTEYTASSFVFLTAVNQ